MFLRFFLGFPWNLPTKNYPPPPPWLCFSWAQPTPSSATVILLNPWNDCTSSKRIIHGFWIINGYIMDYCYMCIYIYNIYVYYNTITTVLQWYYNGIDPTINSITQCQLALNRKLISGIIMIFYIYIIISNGLSMVNGFQSSGLSILLLVLNYVLV